MIEFDCCECGRNIVAFVGKTPEPPLCALCLSCPGWTEDPKLVAIFDPERAQPSQT